MREDGRCSAARVALGCEPEGPKQREGDGRTPEGVYAICLVKERGKYGRSLGPVLSGHTGCAGGAFAGGDRPGYLSRCGQGPSRGPPGPHGDRRWAERSIFMREEANATGPRGVSRWTLRTWIVFFPCGTGWRPWRSGPRQVAFQRGICYTTRGRARRGSDGQSSMSGGLEGRRPATSIVAESAQCSVCPSRLIPSGRSAQQPTELMLPSVPSGERPGSTVPVPGFGSLAQGFFEGGCAA